MEDRKVKTWIEHDGPRMWTACRDGAEDEPEIVILAACTTKAAAEYVIRIFDAFLAMPTEHLELCAKGEASFGLYESKREAEIVWCFEGEEVKQ